MAKQDNSQKDQIRELAESNLLVFAKLVSPNRVYGDIHETLFKWWTRRNAKDNQLVLLPRDHQKSHCAAVKAAWEITRDPAITILYVSATADLAERQLYAIKNILTSDIYRRYWPEMVEPEEGKREMWNVKALSVDHPARKAEQVRDATVTAVGITANITGLHTNSVYLDDLVVPKNAYTEEGRRNVRRMYSQLASIETTGATETVVGTRYHPADIYNDLIEMEEVTFDDEGNVDKEEKVYEVFERTVETDGRFLWPREARSDGKYFGFDWKQLARKKAKYLDKDQFYAQYYNDPNDPESHRLDRSRFQYYNPELLLMEYGVWKYQGKRLRVYAAADLAFTVKKSSDYTAIVVVGVDEDGYIYVLEASRFRTNKYEEYYQRIMDLHRKWRFSKIQIETNVGGNLVSGYLRDEVRRNGDSLIIDQQHHGRTMGSKEERIAAILEPRYDNLSIFHFKGGTINILEEELILSNPKHDDLKDALASAVSIARPPAKMEDDDEEHGNVVYHSRFGGIAL